MKIIGFDNWTQGAHNYQRLLTAFKNSGLELTLIHLGSWGNDPGRPKEERIGELCARDISFYGRKSLLEILDLENPSAVLFLSTETFAHRAFNRYCRQRRVPTVHLFHAIRGVGGYHGVDYKVNRLTYLAFALGKLPKALKYVWPSYSAALWRTNARLSEWVRFIWDIVSGALAIIPKAFADDARADRCCVYIEADKDFAVDAFGFSPKHVIAVGNPDLSRFGLSPTTIGCCVGQSLASRSDVMYVDSGLIALGYVFKSENESIQHIIDTRDELAHQGKHLIFKPHPSQSEIGVLSPLRDAGIEICSTETFIPRLLDCCACLVEPSSVAVLSALTGLPVFLVNYGKLKGQSFGSAVTGYPRAKSIQDLRQFNSMLAGVEREDNSHQVMQWIERNSGPLPAEEMPRRVVQVVESVIKTPDKHGRRTEPNNSRQASPRKRHAGHS